MHSLREKQSKTIILLTTREKEVLRLLIDGHTCREVAVELFLSPETVKTHRRNLYYKLDVRTGVQLGAVWVKYLEQ